MKDRPSLTAAWVAGCRGLGVLLPEEARLADDPFGARFAKAMRVFQSPRLSSALVPQRVIVYMQVRTRAIDDVLLAFVRGGGKQVVLLGAGFDCRALRFAHELDSRGVVTFEVDHPATQARKREVLREDVGAKVAYVEWNFETRAMSELLPVLAEHGHDRHKPTLTIWEGVTMYLTDGAIDASVRAMHAYSAVGSRVVFTYVERRLFEKPTLRARLAQRFVSRMGEPFRFGWNPQELPMWLTMRGFVIERDATMQELSRELLPERFALTLDDSARHICTCRVAKEARL